MNNMNRQFNEIPEKIIKRIKEENWITAGSIDKDILGAVVWKSPDPQSQTDPKPGGQDSRSLVPVGPKLVKIFKVWKVIKSWMYKGPSAVIQAPGWYENSVES